MPKTFGETLKTRLRDVRQMISFRKGKRGALQASLSASTRNAGRPSNYKFFLVDVSNIMILWASHKYTDSLWDNVLAEFGSMVDTVCCAVEIQKEIRLRNTYQIRRKNTRLNIVEETGYGYSRECGKGSSLQLTINRQKEMKRSFHAHFE